MIHGDAKTSDCLSCEALPNTIAAPGRLHLWFALGHSARKLNVYLSRNRQWRFEAADADSVLIDVNAGEWGRLVADLSGLFSSVELDDIKVLSKVGFENPTLSDIPKVRSLKQLIASERTGWLLPVLLDQRLTSVFQPIVWASNPTDIYAQECLLRAKGLDGALVSAEPILDAARDARLIAQTNLAARHTAIREAARHGVESHLFINLAPTSVHDPQVCLRSTIGTIDGAGISRNKVVFEITEKDKADDVHDFRILTDYCRDNGFRVALDDVGSGYSSLNLIHRLRPDFIKLDMELVRGVDCNPYKATVARKIIEIANDLDVSTVAEGVETSGEMGWVRAHGATFAQGWFISKPVNPPIRTIPSLIGDERAMPA
jgi:EAL domain-containing protein (putative c-di-GMP-specific phosphodiesterase class I)